MYFALSKSNKKSFKVKQWQANKFDSVRKINFSFSRAEWHSSPRGYGLKNALPRVATP